MHIWAPSPDEAYQEQITDETTGQTSSVLVLDSPGDGPLTPAFDTQQIGNALDWGAVDDTPMAFVWEIGHSDLFGDHPGQFCVPGQTFCGSFNNDNWAGITPIRILSVTFGDGSHPQSYAAVRVALCGVAGVGSWVFTGRCCGPGSGRRKLMAVPVPARRRGIRPPAGPDRVGRWGPADRPCGICGLLSLWPLGRCRTGRVTPSVGDMPVLPALPTEGNTR